MSETMKAGAELDRLVAEKVMGWKWQHIPGASRKFLCPPDFNQLYSNATSFPEEPLFSRDISAAWQVVEKMRQTHTFHLSDNNDEPDLWFCSFGPKDYDTHHEGYVRRAASAEMAIVLAAIKATEAK